MADLIQIIKYEGDNETFIWKSEIEDFNTGTQLIVHESQEAVFFMNGQALDLFGSGRHTLETQNIPLVRKFFNKPTNDKTPFHCEIYFVNKTEQMAIGWGTDGQVQYMDPQYKFPLQIGARGEMFIRVEDSKKLLVKVVGTERSLTQEVLVQKFRAFLMSKIKPYLAQTMQSSEFGIFEVDAHMDTLGDVLHKQLIPDFSDYGLSLERFLVTGIKKPEGEKIYEEFKDLHARQHMDIARAKLRMETGVIDEEAAKQRRLIEAQGLAGKRDIEGYSYQQERAYDVAEKVAQNEGSGNFANAGIGMGMMGGVASGMGGVVGGIVTDAFSPIRPQANAGTGDSFGVVAGVGIVPPTIDLKEETKNPVPEAYPNQDSTPAKPPSSSEDMNTFEQRLEKLKIMKDKGMLTEEKYQEKLSEILKNL